MHLGEAVSETIEQRPRKADKWSEFLAGLDAQPGIIVCAEALAERIRAARPDRDVRTDERTGPGAALVFTFDTLPLHLYTKAERRRAQRG